VSDTVVDLPLASAFASGVGAFDPFAFLSQLAHASMQMDIMFESVMEGYGK
jgi:hypothetical protein